MVYPGDDDLARTAISGAEFTEALNAIKAKRLTVVLDCCHAGGIGEPRDVGPKPVQPGLSDGYLDELKAGTGRAIISATRGSDPAYVRDGARYGVFTGHFLDGLRGAARGDGGVIRVLDLYSYVQEKVVADQPNQRPVLKVELEENYPIALYRGGEPPAPAPVERPQDGFAYDLFLSYNPAEPDKTWVRKTLLPRLKAEGLKVFIDYVDFRLGAPDRDRDRAGRHPEPLHRRRAVAGLPRQQLPGPGERPRGAPGPGAEPGAIYRRHGRDVQASAEHPRPLLPGYDRPRRVRRRRRSPGRAGPALAGPGTDRDVSLSPHDAGLSSRGK